MYKNNYLDELESRSIYIIREAYWQYKDKLSMLWSMGKDSTTLMHLIRKSFLGDVPFPVIHIDTGLKFQQIYAFRDKYAKQWGLKLIVAGNGPTAKERVSPLKDKFACCTALKTEALKSVIEKYDFSALFVGIRRDEHAIRAKERYFSLRTSESKWDYRNQPMELWAEYYKTIRETGQHFRVHPLLHWREIDIWRYIKRERIPVINLYFSQGGKRYRSIGCECCCLPIESKADGPGKIIKEIQGTATAERAGRAQDKEKEYMMQRLRSLGYM